MQTVNDSEEQGRMRRLQVEWGGYVLTALAFLAAFYLVLRRDWEVDHAGLWLLPSLALAVYQFVYLWRHLSDNRPTAGAALFPTLGLGNWMTLTRGLFNAALAGFLVGPWPTGWLAWAPSTLYLTASLMDLFDGGVARMTGRLTVLGEILDMNWDGAGMLLAATLAVLYGQAPVPFLLVGLARYLFLIGIWHRTRRGLPVYDLLPSRIRRPFAGSMMGFVAVILMPVYAPPPTQVAATLFMIPFLTSFLRDWLTVSGQIRPAADRATTAPRPWRRRWQDVFPLVVRAILVILLVEFLLAQFRQPAAPAPGMIVVVLLALPALLLGAAGRVFSMAVLLMTGLGLQAEPWEWRYWLIMLVSVTAMMVGTGRFSLWKPEDWLLFKRVGEPPSITQAQQ